MEVMLVSVIVITYNSEEFIIQTLESIKKQTYKHIELIISDDNSTDRTIDLCINWQRINQEFFYNFKIITSDRNNGIAANCNRGFWESKGDWIKFLAGDDLLFPDAIEKYIDFADCNIDCEIMHAKQVRIIDHGNKFNLYRSEAFPITIDENIPPNNQFKILCFSSTVKAPTVFIKRQLFLKYNCFDENIRLCEDWPFWLKITQLGVKFHFINDELVYYRIHNKSVYSSNENKFFIHPFLTQEYKIYSIYIRPHINFFQKTIFDYHYFLKLIFLKFNNFNFYYIKYILFNTLDLAYRIYFKLIIKRIFKTNYFLK